MLTLILSTYESYLIFIKNVHNTYYLKLIHLKVFFVYHVFYCSAVYNQYTQPNNI